MKSKYEKPKIEQMEPIDIICDLIAQRSPIVITRHVFPDGDAYGSSRALRDAIHYVFPDKVVRVINTDQNESFNWSGEDDTMHPSLHSHEHALGIVLDTNNVGRVSDDLIFACPVIVKIDHHPKTYKNDENYAHVEWVDPRRASCSEMVAELIFELVDRYMPKDLPNKFADIPESVNRSLYMGMITDTGRFRFPSVTGRTLHTAARIVDKVDTNDLYSKLYVDTQEVFDFKRLMYSRVRKTVNGVLYVIIRNKDLEKCTVKPERVGQFVNIMDCVEGSPIWVAFVQTDDGVRASIRSRTIPINQIAERYSGGGHKNAAGCILPNFAKVDKLLYDLDRCLVDYVAENGPVR